MPTNGPTGFGLLDSALLALPEEERVEAARIFLASVYGDGCPPRLIDDARAFQARAKAARGPHAGEMRWVGDQLVSAAQRRQQQAAARAAAR